MDVNAELAKAVQQRFTKVHGEAVPSKPKVKQQNSRSNRKPEPTMAKASKNEAKKAAAAAIMARMGGNRQPPPSAPKPTEKKAKKSFKMPFSKAKISAVANSTASGPLSKAEEGTAQKYRKMMKMGLPEGAVRHKMVSDGVSQKIVEVVMSGEEASPVPRPTSNGSSSSPRATASLSSAEEKMAEKYRKMIKVGMPEGAVLHKMIGDGVPANIRDVVMAGEEPSQPARGPARSQNESKPTGSGRSSSLSPQEEKIAAQYRRMLRIKMPEGAVRHKMIADGVSQKIQDSVMNGEAPASSSSPPPSSRGGSTGPVSSLSKEDEKMAAPYRKMMRMKMPEGAVRHKMNIDRVSQHIQDSVLGGEVPGTPSSSPPSSSSRGGATGPVSSLSKQDENVATPYRKMMRMKMPEGAVRHKMNIDKVSQHIQDSVLGGEVPGTSSPSPSPSLSSSRGKPVGPVSSLSREDEKVAAPYRKMMRMKMPEGAVRHKMTIDCIPEPIQNSVLRGETPRGDSGASAPPPMLRPANPMAAAINSSGGIGSLKKAPVNKSNGDAPVARPPSNPMAAAIASSGGLKSLKKTAVKEKKPAPPAASSNPLAAAIAASGGRSGLKKTSPKANTSPPPKPTSGNSLLDELSSKGFRSGLRKARQPEKASSEPPTLSTCNAVAAELSSNTYRSTLRKGSRSSPYGSPDVSNSDSMADDVYSGEFSLRKEEPKVSNGGNSRRHLSGIKVKSVRAPTPERSTNSSKTNDSPPRHRTGTRVRPTRSPTESPERSNSAPIENERPSRYSNLKIKAVRPAGVSLVEESHEGKSNEPMKKERPSRYAGIKVKGVRPAGASVAKTSPERNSSRTNEDRPRRKPTRSPKESPERSTHETNEGDRPSRYSGMKVKTGRRAGAPQPADESPERSNNMTIENDYDSNYSEMKIRAARPPEEIRQSNGSIVSELQEQHPRSVSGRVQTRDAAFLEQNFAKAVHDSMRSQTMRTADMSARSASRSKRRDSRGATNNFANPDRRIRKTNAVTTADGVDHHCQCIVM